jgi:hypothetical protein
MVHISTTQLGKLLGVPPDLIQVAYRKGYLSEPSSVRGRRTFGLPDVIDVARYFGVEPGQRGHDRKSGNGTPR